MNSLQEYGELFCKLDLTELTVVEGDRKLCLKRKRPEAATIISTAKSEKCPEITFDPASPIGEIKEPESTLSKSDEQEQGTTVKAPLLGIFTSSVKAGDHVKTGDALGMIEAMKMMNDVQSPIDGTVLEVLASDGDLVEFDQKLFVIS